jgi:hypothetical protein
MKPRVIDFTVEEVSDNLVAKRAIMDLRRMARYGKVAQRALEELDRKGFCDTRVPMMTDPARTGNSRLNSDTYYDTQHTVYVKRLPKKETVSRKDLPAFNPIEASLALSERRILWKKDQELLYLELTIKGPAIIQTQPEKSIYEVEEKSARMETVVVDRERILYPFMGSNFMCIEKGSDQYEESVELFAESVSEKLCVLSPYKPTAKTMEMSRRAEEWLITEGVAARLLDDICRMARIHQVMES